MSTTFDLRVYEALRRVPRGMVTTYGELARAVGCGSSRAVGRALRRNPFAPEVPCHRVIASNLAPGGFQGRRDGPEQAAKLRLLRGEGVRFRNGRLADPSRLFRFSRG
jgi:methylated-DNA-[protein]-cysteine S-methyltransferase